MKNILAENMLRFGTKNISEADVKKRLTESTLEQLDPSWVNAQKYFASAWSKNMTAPQFATANLIYVGQPKDGNDPSRGSVLKYEIQLYKIIARFNFLVPGFFGYASYDNATGMQAPANLELMRNNDSGISDLKSTSAEINRLWNSILPDVATTNLNSRKSDPKIATWIKTIKASPTFTQLEPLLTGTAKIVYNSIAAL